MFDIFSIISDLAQLEAAKSLEVATVIALTRRFNRCGGGLYTVAVALRRLCVGLAAASLINIHSLDSTEKVFLTERVFF